MHLLLQAQAILTSILQISGDSGAVRQAVISAREVGKQLLGTMGDEPVNGAPSYIYLKGWYAL